MFCALPALEMNGRVVHCDYHTGIFHLGWARDLYVVDDSSDDTDDAPHPLSTLGIDGGVKGTMGFAPRMDVSMAFKGPLSICCMACVV